MVLFPNLQANILNTYHLLLFSHIGSDEIVEEEEGVRIDGHKNVVIEFGDEAAQNFWLIFCNRT